MRQLKEEDDSQVSSDDSGDSGDESSHWCTRSNQCVAEDEQFYDTVEVEETRKSTRSWQEEFRKETKVETEQQAVLTIVTI